MPDDRLDIPVMTAAADRLADLALPVFDATAELTASRLVWLDSRPGLGSKLILEETLRTLVGRQQGWSLAAHEADGWRRLGSARHGLSQPRPQPLADGIPPWLCLTLDGAQGRQDDDSNQLLEKMGVLALTAEMWKPGSADALSKIEAFKRIASGSGEVIANKAVGTLVSSIPFVGGVASLAFEIVTNMDREAARALKPTLPRRRSAPGADAEVEQEMLVGAATAVRLLELAASFDTETVRAPVVVFVGDAELARTEVQAFVFQLLGDARSTTRDVVVVASTSTTERVDWLEQLSSIGPDHDAPTFSVDAVRVSQGHRPLSPEGLEIGTLDVRSAETLVQWFAPDGAFEEGVTGRMVERASVKSRVSIDLLLEYMEDGAGRHSRTGAPLTLEWAGSLTSGAAKAATEAVAGLFARRPTDMGADVLAGLVSLGGSAGAELRAALLAEFGDGAEQAFDSLVTAGLVAVKGDVARVTNLIETQAALDAEFTRRPASERTAVEERTGRAAANWLWQAASEIESGARNPGEVLVDAGEAVTIGLSAHVAVDRSISARMRLVLSRPAPDSGDTSAWFQAARASLLSAKAARDEGWITLAHAFATVDTDRLPRSLVTLRDAVVGEVLGFLADTTGCPGTVRRHWAAVALIRRSRQSRTHVELTERATVAVLADQVPGTEYLINDLPPERVRDLFGALASSPASGRRDSLLARCVGRGVDPGEALRVLVRDADPLNGEFATETAIAVANLSDGMDDETLDQVAAPQLATSDDSEGDVASVPVDRPEDGDSGAPDTAEGSTMASSVRHASVSVLSRALSQVEVDWKRARVLHGAVARIVLSSGDVDRIGDAYSRLRPLADIRADGPLLCRLAEHLPAEMRAELRTEMLAIGKGAEQAVSMARLCHEGDEPPRQLLAQLERHQRNPRCAVHLQRLDGSGTTNAALANRLREAAREGGSAGLEELYEFRERDRRVLPLLAELLVEAQDERAGDLAGALLSRMKEAGGATDALEILAFLRLAGWAKGDRSNTVLSAAAGAALELGIGWQSADMDAACRAIISPAARDLLPRALISEATRQLGASTMSVENAMALCGALRTPETDAEGELLSEAKRVLMEHAGARQQSPDSALFALEHLAAGMTNEEARAVWNSIRFFARRDPRVALKVNRLARQHLSRRQADLAARMYRYRDDSEEWIRFHAPLDPECAVHIARSSLRNGGEVDRGTAEKLVLWAQPDPGIAVAVAQLFSLRGSEKGDADPLGIETRRRLRSALLRHSRESSRCALALLQDSEPTRAEVEAVYEAASVQRNSVEWAAVMCRAATTPARAVDATNRLWNAVQRAKRNDPRADSTLFSTPGIRGVPVLEAFAALAFYRYGAGAGRFQRAVEDCLDAASEDVDHPRHARRMLSYAVVLQVFSNRHSFVARASKGRQPRGGTARDLGVECFEIMHEYASDPRSCAPFLPSLVEVARKTGRDRTADSLVAQYVASEELPSSFAVAHLLEGYLKSDRKGGMLNADGWRRHDALRKAAETDPTALAAHAIFVSARIGKKANLKELLRHCRVGRDRAAAFVEYVRCTEVDHPGLCKESDRSEVPGLMHKFLREWDRQFSDIDHLSERFGHRCLARTEGLDHPALLVVRACVLFRFQEREQLLALMPQLRENVENPVVAFALGRVATSSFDLERVREVLMANAEADPVYADELMRLGLTLRRRKELFGKVRDAQFESAEERAVLLGRLAVDNSEKHVALSEILALEKPTPRALVIAAELSESDPEYMDSIVEMRDRTKRPADRALLTSAMIPFYAKQGGFNGLGESLVDWLGPESGDARVALDVLEVAGSGALDARALREDQREALVTSAIKGAIDGDVPLDRVLSVLTEGEVGAHLLEILERHRNERLAVPLAYQYRELHDPSRVAHALKRFWSRSAESVFATLKVLEDRDMDDEQFSAAWNFLAAQAMTSPRLLVRLVLLSKRPLSQLALFRLLLGFQVLSRRSEAVQAFSMRAEAEIAVTLDNSRGRAPRKRRLAMAASTVYPTRSNRTNALKLLMSPDSTVVQLAALSLAGPSEGERDRLVELMTEHGDDRDVLVETLLLGARVDVASLRLAIPNLFLGDGTLAMEGMEEVILAVMEVTQALALRAEHDRILAAILSRPSIPERLASHVASTAPVAMLEDVVRLLAVDETDPDDPGPGPLRTARRRLERVRTPSQDPPS